MQGVADTEIAGVRVGVTVLRMADTNSLFTVLT
jgi:hypothetical protein